MKKILFTAVLSVFVMLLSASCRSVDTANQPQHSPANFDNQAIACGSAMLEAFEKDDYKSFSSNLPENLKQEFTQDDFNAGRKQVTESAGNVCGSRYLGKLTGPVFSNFLWAVKFSRKNNKNTVDQELLFKVTFAKDKDKAQAVSFGFML